MVISSHVLWFYVRKYIRSEMSSEFLTNEKLEGYVLIAKYYLQNMFSLIIEKINFRTW